MKCSMLKLTRRFLRPQTRSSSQPRRCRWRLWPSTKPSQPSRSRTNLRLQPSTIVAETGEAEVAVTGEAAETVEAEPAAVVVHRVEVTRTSIGVKDTPLIPQRAVVNAIMSMGTRLGTVWNPPPAPGLTDVLREIEKLTNLTRKKIKIFNTTRCFQA